MKLLYNIINQNALNLIDKIKLTVKLPKDSFNSVLGIMLIDLKEERAAQQE
jgi:hypothetical protein